MVESDYVLSTSFQIIPTIVDENETSTLNSQIWDVLSQSTIDQLDPSEFLQIKNRIRSFIRDHPSILDQIEKHFSNEIIEHILKRALRVEFTQKDFEQTKEVYQKFFNEQYSNLEIIISYFLDDIRSLILTGKFQNLPWPFRHAVIYTPNSVLTKGALTWIYLKGSQKFTEKLYENVLNQNQQLTQNNSFAFDEQHLKIFFIVLIFLLLSININSIGFIVNCFGVCVFLIFIFSYSFIYLKRFL